MSGSAEKPTEDRRPVRDVHRIASRLMIAEFERRVQPKPSATLKPCSLRRPGETYPTVSNGMKQPLCEFVAAVLLPWERNEHGQHPHTTPSILMNTKRQRFITRRDLHLPSSTPQSNHFAVGGHCRVGHDGAALWHAFDTEPAETSSACPRVVQHRDAGSLASLASPLLLTNQGHLR